MKHTTGKWEANKWATGWEVCAPNEHYTVAKLSDCNNAESNSRLIAAAPELLDALKDMLFDATNWKTRERAIDLIHRIEEE